MRQHLVAAFGFSTLVSLTATPLPLQAEPQVLTPSQLEAVTAAGPVIRLPAINLNVTAQMAVPISVAIAACGICRDGVSASSGAIGTNFNTSLQR